jgi:hypothetical protein
MSYDPQNWGNLVHGKLNTLNYSSAEHSFAIFFLGNPETGRGMRGRGIRQEEVFSPFPGLSFLCQIFSEMNDFQLWHSKNFQALIKEKSQDVNFCFALFRGYSLVTL